MSIYIGNSQIDKLYIGNQKIGKVYIGSQLIYSDYTKCIDRGQITDRSAFTSFNNVRHLNVYQYTSDYPIFGITVDGDYSEEETQQDLSVTGKIYIDPAYIGERCTISYESFWSARNGTGSAYIKNGNDTLTTYMDPSVEEKRVWFKTFTISDTELKLHAEYHGISTDWAPSVWLGIGSMEIGTQ